VKQRYLVVILFHVMLLFVAACSAGVGPEQPGIDFRTPSPFPTEPFPVTEEPPVPTSTPFIEQRFIEVEWPPNMRLGDSDIIRLSLIPTEGGHIPQVEFEQHDLDVQTTEIPHLAGFEAFAIARMNAVGFQYSPEGDQEQRVIQTQILNWRWSISPENPGTHRLSLQLRIRWEPIGEGRTSEVNIWDSGIEVKVKAPFGIEAPQARMLGVVGILVGVAMALPLAEFATRRRLERIRASRVRRLQPNLDLELDIATGIHISQEERILLQALYNRYNRLTVETRYSSGYSGARTLLVQPSHADGRIDAHAIVKIGSAREIQAEYSNYESFVRHTLPPVTSRVQGPPVLVSNVPDAALEYTFVGMPGVSPTSFRSFVLSSSAIESQDLIENCLFATFGAGWWMQRVPYSFRLGQEYDRLLPVHLVLEASDERRENRVRSGNPSDLDGLQEGEVIRLENATVIEVRSKRKSATLSWQDNSFTPFTRVRFQNTQPGDFSEGTRIRSVYGRVVATRDMLLRSEVARSFPELNLDASQIGIWGRRVDNPLMHLRTILESRVTGTQSIIHGDLNLENILVGPGDLVWLIDFASTREGHTLFDFARLEAEITTQVISEIFIREGYGPESFYKVLDALEVGREPEGDALRDSYRLLNATRQVAGRLLFDTAGGEELDISLYLAYLGTLKFSNLDELPSAPIPKTLAFTAAAYLITKYLNSN
jgi:hypothetical protein